MGGFIAAFLISVGIWCIRFKYDRPPVNNDFKWVFFWLLWLCRQDVYSRIVRGSTSFWIVTVIIFFSIAIYYLVSSLLRKGVFISQHEYEGKRTMKEAGSFDFSHLKPLVFPCRTSHTRMFPKIHSFSYSYLFVGIPIGWKSSRGHSISTNVESLPAEADAINAYQQKQKSWFTVEAADYLNRGNHARGLKGKLEDFIKSQVCICCCSMHASELNLIRRMRTLKIILILIWSPLLASLGILSIPFHSGICTTRKKS